MFSLVGFGGMVVVRWMGEREHDDGCLLFMLSCCDCERCGGTGLLWELSTCKKCYLESMM
jgi:hypothetical protein